MKKSKKVAIIAAIVMLIVGSLISIGALVSLNFDFLKLSSGNFVTNTYTIDDDFSDIFVNGDVCDIRFVPAENNVCKVICNENDNILYSVNVEENTLRITKYDDSKWYEHIGIYFGGSAELTVYLPQRDYESLKIENASGNVNIDESFSFGSADITSATGDIDFSANVTGRTNIFSVSGDINIFGINCENIKVSTTSGNILLSDVIANDSINCESISGEINLNSCDGKNLDIKTTSGDVKGTLLSGKDFIADTISGNINVPNSSSEERCQISTVSGNIDISVI